MAEKNTDSIERLQKGLIVALIAIVGILILVLALRQLRGGSELLAPISSEVTAGAAQGSSDISELLADARRAMAASQLVAPVSDNAYEYYLSVLEQQPTNPSAREALNDLYGIAVSSAEQAIAAGDLDEAERLTQMLGQSNPNSFTVVNLNQRIERGRNAAVAAASAAEAAAAAAAANQGQAAAPAAPVEEVVAPAATPEPVSDLASALSPTAPPPAEPVVTPPPVAATPLPGTTTTTTTRPAQTTSPTADVREARLLARVDPEYPREAMRGRQQGWVELEFTIGRDGGVSDIQVVAARPARVFDRAAIRAMQDWRFEPRMEGGQPVASRLRQRFDFRLD